MIDIIKFKIHRNFSVKIECKKQSASSQLAEAQETICISFIIEDITILIVHNTQDHKKSISLKDVTFLPLGYENRVSQE